MSTRSKNKKNTHVYSAKLKNLDEFDCFPAFEALHQLKFKCEKFYARKHPQKIKKKFIHKNSWELTFFDACEHYFLNTRPRIRITPNLTEFSEELRQVFLPLFRALIYKMRGITVLSCLILSLKFLSIQGKFICWSCIVPLFYLLHRWWPGQCRRRWLFLWSRAYCWHARLLFRRYT